LGYKFRLQKILDVKEKEEDNKKNEVGKVNAEIAVVKTELEQIYKELEENGIKREKKNRQGASIQEVLELNKYCEYLKNIAIKKKEKELQGLQEKLTIKKQEYMDSRKQRKSYETLKDKDYQKFVQKEAKEEEKVIDEIVSFTSRKV
jgi:flagellar export protein fliJ